MARILITGASGFLGSNLALHAAEKGHQVWGTHLSQPFTLKGVEARKLDVCLPEAIHLLLSEIRPDLVFHLAAVSQPDACARDSATCRHINVQGSKLLAAACAASGAKIVFSSSDLVFDGSIKFAREEDKANPLGTYGRSKLDAEKAVLEAGGAKALVMRTVLMYGWGRASGRSFAENWLRSLLTHKPLAAFTDQFRCPIWVEDLCAAMLAAAEAGLSGVYHAAGPERSTRYDFGRRLALEFGFPPDGVIPTSMDDFVFEDPRPKECSLNIEKLSAAIPFSPLGVDAGLKAMHDKLLTLR